MALTMIYPEGQRGKKIGDELRKKLSNLGKTETAGEVRLNQARTVLQHSRAKADDMTLDKALAEAKAEQDAVVSAGAMLALKP